MPHFGSVGNFVVVTRFCQSEINTLSDAIADAEHGATNMPQRHLLFRHNGTGVGKSTEFFASVTCEGSRAPTVMQRTPLLRRKALIWAILMGHHEIPKIETRWGLLWDLSLIFSSRLDKQRMDLRDLKPYF